MVRMEKRPRIALVVPTFPKLSETFIVNQFLGLLERGWDAHVVCDTSEPAEWEQFPQLRERRDLRPRVHRSWPHRPRWMALLLWPLVATVCALRNPAACARYLSVGFSKWGWATLRQWYLDAPFLAVAPDVIHFEFGALAPERLHLKEMFHCKMVASFRGYDLHFSGLEDPEHYQSVWKEMDGLHLLGQGLWRRAQERGCPSDKLHVLIPPAINAQFFNPGDRAHRDLAGTLERPLRILSVGRLEWVKGYEYALQAIRLLHDQGVRCSYEIVGAGQYLEAVAFARHQLGVEKQAHLLGALAPAQVKEKMLQADVFLHAGISEGFCNAVLEAQAMMLPVVCSDADGLIENVMEGETGFIVPRRNPAALAEKLARLAAHPQQRQALGAAGRRRVLSHFQVSDQLAAFERLYRQVISAQEWTGQTSQRNVAPVVVPIAADKA
jgi:colanic acid/amylovoran biosynthesis glycosyltransferase